ncbi:MAG: putative small integral membrane protein [Halieaceae bacterium]|jgi:predicted small integral membrane protein
MQRLIKIIMILLVGCFGLLGAGHNLIAFESDIALVSQVVSGAGAHSVAEWQKIETPVLIWLCWMVIPLAKLATGLLCCAGAARMWTARHADAEGFQQAKYLGVAGCGVMLAMLFGVFILIAETWFQQWQTALGAAILPAAHRYMLTIGLLALFVNLRDD